MDTLSVVHFVSLGQLEEELIGAAYGAEWPPLVYVYLAISVEILAQWYSTIVLEYYCPGIS